MTPKVSSNSKLVVSLLFYYCPTATLSVTTETPSSTSDWIKIPVPLYYVIGLAALLLFTVVSCIACLCFRRKRNQEFAVDPGHIECNNSKRERNEISSTNPDDSNRDSNCQSKKQINDTKNQAASNEVELKCLNEKDKTEDQPSATNPEKKCDSVENSNQEDIKTAVWKPREEQENKLTSNDDLEPESKDPVYAEVNKNKKGREKVTSNVVYAELADFNAEKDNKGCQGKRQSTEYAQIARLAKSPRDMSPLDN